jgi:hypothetical protein
MGTALMLLCNFMPFLKITHTSCISTDSLSLFFHLKKNRKRKPLKRLSIKGGIQTKATK